MYLCIRLCVCIHPPAILKNVMNKFFTIVIHHKRCSIFVSQKQLEDEQNQDIKIAFSYICGNHPILLQSNLGKTVYSKNTKSMCFMIKA
mmetsp:Transcript_19724/g.29052  ORF Transcript_19724/g.29052 Transcript_19724/m.29052 type:complete len:89 (+) Transcript_19724:142-408(+)